MADEYHGNDHRSNRLHHLYEIRDSEDDDIVKYGIAGGPLGQDGSSPRANGQVNYLNRAVGWLRFFAIILLTNIPGRKRAKELEDEHIDQYEAANGERPRGNP
ncbi:MAG: hypothetical protein AAFN92_01645 [Bacteroidota bacterium]